eukprot:5348109-Prymnesium_polylepis.1
MPAAQPRAPPPARDEHAPARAQTRTTSLQPRARHLPAIARGTPQHCTLHHSPVHQHPPNLPLGESPGGFNPSTIKTIQLEIYFIPLAPRQNDSPTNSDATTQTDSYRLHSSNF